MRTILGTPPIPKTTPDDVWDAFGWCASDDLEWVSPGGPLRDAPFGADNPPGMVFVLKRELAFLPKEPAALHLPWLDDPGSFALAPYAIDDATDELYRHRMRPRDALFLATDSLAGLFWGLHDWAHFHNHGPFERRAWTELHCDASALAWLWKNRGVLALHEHRWREMREAIVEISRSRFTEEGEELPRSFYELCEID